jgi:hypothetical protein
MIRTNLTRKNLSWLPFIHYHVKKQIHYLLLFKSWKQKCKTHACLHLNDWDGQILHISKCKPIISSLLLHFVFTFNIPVWNFLLLLCTISSASEKLLVRHLSKASSISHPVSFKHCTYRSGVYQSSWIKCVYKIKVILVRNIIGTTEKLWFDSRHIQEIPLAKASRPALGPTQPPIENGRGLNLTTQLHSVLWFKKSVLVYFHSTLCLHDVTRSAYNKQVRNTHREWKFWSFKILLSVSKEKSLNIL